ncbi:VWA domain-containing protein [Pseudophaeobacter sp.]|uniref:vWA domain-containing protein n=2 Tax=Rhodobacterales TaxID=204455 RepID=UPI0032986FB7
MSLILSPIWLLLTEGGQHKEVRFCNEATFALAGYENETANSTPVLQLDSNQIVCHAIWMRIIGPLIVSAFCATSAGATDNCASDAMIVLDGSGSMAEMGFNDINEPRIFEARRAISETIPEIAENRRLGLVVYGPKGVDECSGLDVRFPPMANAAKPVIDAVNALEPDGSTPLTDAVKLAADALDYQNRPAAIILVTDGKETCGGQPCKLATDLANEGADTTVHVIGFKVRGTFFSWDRDSDNDYNVSESVARCLADRTGGTYTSAETLDQLIAALRDTLGCQLLF